jgi:hexosaminidase
MRIYLLTILLFYSIGLFSQSSDPNLGIIPAPNSVVQKNGFFQLSSKTAIVFSSEADRKIAELFRDLVKEQSGFDLVVAKNLTQETKSAIMFSSIETGQFKDEAYQININENQIELKGKERGLFYAMQSLSQMYLRYKSDQKIPQAIIKDEPRYVHRGMHLDVVRHFFSIAYIKKYIDLMAFYKLNNFHWHLTDDQGWRLEIKKYPKLTSIGAYRAQTLIGNYHDRRPQWFDGVPYGTFYTQEEAKEIVAYAATKYINVIPEIEMPGHAVAALASYPELACGEHPGPFKVEEKWGVFPDIFCAGKDQTFDFLENVLTEVMDIFPSKYIHIGGDEAPKTRWKTCKFCQQRIKSNKLKNEDALQSYFIHKIEKFVNKKGRLIIGWDEILDGGLAPNATVMSWRGVQGGIAAAKRHNDVIMTPSTNALYFDHVQGRSDQEPVSIGGNGFIENSYSYNPTPESLTLKEQSYIRGVQANLWTEYVTTEKHIEYMVLPKIMSLSEIAWTNLENKSFKNFTEERVTHHLSWLDKMGRFYRVPTAIGAKDTTINVKDFYVFDLKPSVLGSTIYYTLDGKEPDETSRVYKGNLKVIVLEGETRPFKTRVITETGKRSAVITTWLANRKPFEATSVNVQQGALKYYYVPGKFAAVSEIDTNLATKKGTVNQISLTKITGKAIEYGLVFTGYININEDANFEFSLYSDDGSKLYIDDELIINNDGKHARYERSAGVDLKKGLHKIKVLYFDDGPGSTLRVSIKGTDNKKIEIPAVMLYN